MPKFRTLYCPHCFRERSFRKPRVNHLQCLALTLVSGGIYLAIWGMRIWRRLRSPWRCRTCHHSFRSGACESALKPERPECVGVGQRQKRPRRLTYSRIYRLAA